MPRRYTSWGRVQERDSQKAVRRRRMTTDERIEKEKTKALLWE